MIIALIRDKLPSNSKIGKGRVKKVLNAILSLEKEILKNREFQLNKRRLPEDDK